MVPELETLDLLAGGDEPLAVIRGLYASDDAFARSVAAMLDAGEIQMMLDGAEVPRWRWKELRSAASGGSELSGSRFSITRVGARRA